MKASSNSQRKVMSFSRARDIPSFHAVVKLRIARVELKKARGFEHLQDLSSMPSFTWWWVEVDMVPEAVLEGTWDVARMISVDFYDEPETFKDQHWIGIIVKDGAGEYRWAEGFALRSGTVVDPTREDVLGPEAEILRIVDEYRKRKGF
jgi:hypothetical protein